MKLFLLALAVSLSSPAFGQHIKTKAQAVLAESEIATQDQLAAAEIVMAVRWMIY